MYNMSVLKEKMLIIPFGTLTNYCKCCYKREREREWGGTKREKHGGWREYKKKKSTESKKWTERVQKWKTAPMSVK